MLLVPIRMRIMRKFTLKRLGGLALLAVVAAVAIAPATALAQDALSNPSDSQYEPKSQVQGTSTNGSNGPGSSGTAAANTSTSASGLNGNVGSLPFTGMDVIVLAVVAAALIGTGVALHRLSAPKAPKA
jgi:tetrahydromethanopterin S-methyltransferase subunit E